MQAGLVMMALGAFRFGMEAGAYQRFSRRARWRWHKVARIGRAPALHYLGPDTQEVTIEGVIHPHFRGGLRQVELMRLKAGAGVPMMMVDGLGWVWKRWVIVSVEERKGYFLRDGAPREIGFALTLQSYGPDGIGASFLGGLS